MFVATAFSKTNVMEFYNYKRALKSWKFTDTLFNIDETNVSTVVEFPTLLLILG